jgi:hypothetical protein
MKVQFVAAAALALASLGGCSGNSQTASAADPPCVTTGGPGDGAVPPNEVSTTCPNLTGSNPIVALWSALTGGPSSARASASATRPTG